MIPIALFKKFLSKQFIASVEVSNNARCSRKTNELRNIDSIGCRTRNITNCPSDRNCPRRLENSQHFCSVQERPAIRPSQLLPCFFDCLCCKMLEHIIVSNVVKHVDKYRNLSDCQHGFRARRSCETQLVTLQHDLASTLDRGVQTDMVVMSEMHFLLQKNLRNIMHGRVKMYVMH